MEKLRNIEKVKVCIYCRVSTAEQAEEGYSIGEQERLLMEYCKNQNFEVYKVYSDSGISGKDIVHRPAIQEMLRDATQKKFTLLISWKINRLSRKLADAIKIIDTLEKYNIKYRSYSEPFSTDTPSGKMQFQLMAMIGEFERNTIAENVRMGMIAKARAGEWCGGLAPLGYKWVPMETSGTRKKSKLAINEEEAFIVREIFEMYASGKGYKAIVNEINKQGYKTKRGGSFAVAQLRTILTNPVYIGKVRFNVRREWNEKRRTNINPNPIVVEGIHDAIISEELWARVQVLINEKSGKPSRIHDGEYPLTGILKCPVCGSGMVLSGTTNVLKDGTRKRITYYACGAWKNKGTGVCRSNTIRVEKANRVVFQEIEKLLSNEKFLEQIVTKVNRENRKKADAGDKKQQILEGAIEDRKKKCEKLLNGYVEGVLTNHEYLEHKAKLSTEIERMEAELNEIRQNRINSNGKEVPYEVVRDIVKNFRTVLESDTIDRGMKKQLLHMLIKEITLDKRREVDSIKVKFTDEILIFLENREGASITDVSSFSILRELGCPVLNLKIEI